MESSSTPLSTPIYSSLQTDSRQGSRVKVTNDDPDEAIVVTCEGPTKEDAVSVIYTIQHNGQEVFPSILDDHCEDEGINLDSYSPDGLE